MEEKQKSNTKPLIIFSLFTIIVLGVTFTSAYFIITAGQNEQERITISSGTLSLTFRDNDEIVKNIEETWNFGDTIEKELIIENTGTRDTYAKISWDNLINTYLAESLTYTLEEKTDETDATWATVETEGTNVPRSGTASTQVLADHLFIPAGHTYTYRLQIKLEYLDDIEQSSDLEANFITKFTITESTKKWTAEDSLTELNITINPSNKTTGFETPATTDETANGLFSMEDDYGTSYYYRGTAPNNYIKFGVNSRGQEMWWRIIRFNGDGSIRMQYDGVGAKGTNTYTRGFALTSQVWNTNSDDAKYVGWMFGGEQGSASTSKEEAQRNETNSEIKIAVDRWYKSNIVDTGYSDYVADVIFCNDRSTPGKSATGWSSDTGLGYGSNPIAYGITSRLGGPWKTDVTQPQFTCPQGNDKFTVETSSRGNGALTYPVGLITADEIVAAGSGKLKTSNVSYFLNKDLFYWSFSPHVTPGATVLGVSNGELGGYGVNNDNEIAPVINIKSEYLSKLKGQGLKNLPYYLEMT